MNAHNEQQALPCPFCGAEPDLSFNSVSCGCAASPFIERVDALQVWNTRAAQPSPVVKQNLTTQPAAAQEAVAYCQPDDPLNSSAFSWPGTDRKPSHTTPLYAATVTAAQTLDDELAQDRMSELSKLERDVLDALPAVYYMDPPDGGDVSLGEQVKRMAEDAALWRKHISTPAAPGIDLKAFREPVAFWFEHLVNHPYTETNAARLREAKRLLALIDASPKGDCSHCGGTGDVSGEYPGVACGVCNGTGQKDSPKGGSEALDAARWRYVRRKLCLTGNGDGTCGMQAINLPGSIPGLPDTSDDVVGFCEAAIDAAMQAQAGDAEVQP